MDGCRPPAVVAGIEFTNGRGYVLLSSVDGRRSSTGLKDGKFVKMDSCDQDLGGVSRKKSGEGAGNGNCDKVKDIAAGTHLEEGERPSEEEEVAFGRDSAWLVNFAVEVVDSVEAPSKIDGIPSISGSHAGAESVKGCEWCKFAGRIEKKAGCSGEMVK
ncbi:hypothetical protein MA16_Dca002464 [Dendrobium catenatum]|uniref:Uncharacterized protein n=1 Tax=Dendrobium catenatum TaxID=906689 RepID=A0A2I0W0L0_9ASPA|nr:hypothetical protein MA16_Dca002464 [Dendrobium catenatum]